MCQRGDSRRTTRAVILLLYVVMLYDCYMIVVWLLYDCYMIVIWLLVIYREFLFLCDVTYTCWLLGYTQWSCGISGLDGIGNPTFSNPSILPLIHGEVSLVFLCFFTNKKSVCVYHVGLKNGGFNHIKCCLSIKMPGSIHDNWALASACHILPWQGTPKGSGQEAMCPWRLMTVSSFGWKLRKATGSFKETSKRIR